MVDRKRERQARDILEDIADGTGPAWSPDRWRDAALTLLNNAIERGADGERAREAVRAFLSRMDGRFKEFERAAWRWAAGRARCLLLWLPGDPFEDLERLAVALLGLVREKQDQDQLEDPEATGWEQ